MMRLLIRLIRMMHSIIYGLITESIRVLDSNGISDHDALMAVFRIDDN